MKKLINILMLFLFVGAIANAQTLEELKADKAAKQAMVDAKQAEIDALNGEMDALTTAIHRLSGWRTGVSGLVGFNLSKNNNWVASPNPTASSSALNIGLTGFANKETAKTFWNNKLIVTKEWLDVDLSEADGETQNDALFDNATVDILNLSSLAGYKLTDKFALSGLGELNTSVEQFLEPGTLDIGIGATWLPIQNMTVVVHPLNYRIAFPSAEAKSLGEDISSAGSIGAKLRVDYTRDFFVAGKKIAWSSTLSSFLPYSDTKTTFTDADGVDFEAGLFEYTWLNTLAFEIWNGIGVGVGFGLRDSEFEDPNNTQTYTTVGLSYGF